MNNKIFTLIILLLMISSSEAADFATRCNASGVVKCVGFDNTTTDIVRNSNLFPGDGGYFGGSLDTIRKASGAGSLQFKLPGNRGTSDISGSWYAPFGAAFGPNSDFYAQVQIMISPEMLSNLQRWKSNVDTAWKTVLFHRVGSTCGQIELTTVPYLYNNSGALQMYTGCGTPGLTAATPGTFNANGNLIQQGTNATSGYNCDWQNIVAGTGNGTGCFLPPTNKWTSFYYKIHLGDPALTSLLTRSRLNNFIFQAPVVRAHCLGLWQIVWEVIQKTQFATTWLNARALGGCPAAK